MSNNDSRRLFRRSSILAVLAAVCGSEYAVDARASGTVGIDVGVNGMPPTGDFANTPRVSADGRFVAFAANGPGLVNGVTGPFQRVYLRDITSGTTVLVSRTSTGGIPAVDEAFVSSISEDGRFVSFYSKAQLTPNAPPVGTYAAYLFDRFSNSVELISVASDGSGASGSGAGSDPGSLISQDGRFVLFTSIDPLTPGSGDVAAYRVYRRDRVLQQTILVSPVPSEAFLVDFVPSGLLADGSKALFRNRAYPDSPPSGIYVRDFNQGTTLQINLSVTQGLIDVDDTNTVDWSADGTKIVYDCNWANSALGDQENAWDVYLADTSSGSVLTQTVSLTPSGQHSIGSASKPSISADGRYVCFEAMGADYVPWDLAPSTSDIVIRDLLTQRNLIANVSTSGEQTVNGASWPVISGDGRFVVFTLTGDELDPTAIGPHLYRRDRIGFTQLGYGKPGSGHSIPELNGSGVVIPGGSAQIQLSGAAPFASSVLFLSLDRTYFAASSGAFFGTVLATATPFAVLPFTTDGFGLLTLPFTLPVSALPPELYLQAAILDPLALGGVSVSRALLMGM